MKKKMKRSAALIFCITGILYLEGEAQKKVKYDFPEAMSDEVREGFTKICDKGQILYNINCAKCHNIKIKGKSVIPDFSPSQLKGYELRVSNAQHENSMDDTMVTAEELGMISTFLTYKRKNSNAK